MQINRKLHAKMVESVLQTKLKFFEENTNGRILNRFSKDVGVLDKIVFTYLDLTDVFPTLFHSFSLVHCEVHIDTDNSDSKLPVGSAPDSLFPLLPVPHPPD